MLQPDVHLPKNITKDINAGSTTGYASGTT